MTIPALRRRPLAEQGDQLCETPQAYTRAALRAEIMWAAGIGPGDLLWEPCAGRGAISRELRDGGYQVIAQDLRAYPGADDDIRSGINFFDEIAAPEGCRTIFTNPPFKCADEFIRHALSLVPDVFVLWTARSIEGGTRSDIMDRHCWGIWHGVDRGPSIHADNWNGPRLKQDQRQFAWFWFSQRENLRGVIPLRRIRWR